MKIKIVKKTDEYSSEYQIGDIFEVEGTWYGGVHITGKTGIPVSLDREEYEEITDMTPEEYQAAAVYWVEKDKESKAKTIFKRIFFIFLICLISLYIFNAVRFIIDNIEIIKNVLKIE